MFAWNRWYSIKSYLSSALWTVPLFALVAGRIVKFLSEMLGAWMDERGIYGLNTTYLGLNAAEANAFLDRMFTMNLSFLVFTFGSLLVAIQIAGGQYTPRIIATTLLRDNVIRWIVGLFMFSLIWGNRTMVQISSTVVPQFQVFMAASLAIASLIAFLLLIDYSAKLLRPVSLVCRVGEQGIEVIESIYPSATRHDYMPPVIPKKRIWNIFSRSARRVPAATAPGVRRGPPDRDVYHKGKSAIVLAVNVKRLVSMAQAADCVIEVVPQVGDFLAAEDSLFHVYGNVSAIDDRRLRELVAIGSERTMEQDPMFAFRIEVDIALKALSPAINDPTTAVLAIDQLHRLLRLVGQRSLHKNEITDDEGQPRVIFRTPNWEDFVHMTFREIRQCGAGSLQVARRLRAVIENLLETLPQHRHAALQQELALLDRALVRLHLLAEDLALARIADSQGLGGESSEHMQP